MSIRLKSTQTGFTLLEIVLVLFLLGLMASATLLLTEKVEDQAKYDETKHRLAMIRSAIVGDSSRTINGRPEISGFASDMGRLPNCIRELISARNCDNDADLQSWIQDTDSQVWSGWRGPYLSANAEISGISHFRDGYGNSGTGSAVGSDDWQNSGWNYAISLGAITIVSNGFDTTINTDDIPRPTAVQELVLPFDYQVTLGQDWQDIKLNFNNGSNTNFIIEQQSLRLKFNSPIDGQIQDYSYSEFNTSAQRDASMYFSEAFPFDPDISPVASDVLIPTQDGQIFVEAGQEFEFAPLATLVSGEVRITAATQITLKETSSGTEIAKFSPHTTCNPDCPLLITTSDLPVTSPVNTITFSSDQIVTLPEEFIAPTAPNFGKPFIIVPDTTTVSSGTVSLPAGATITLPDNSPTLDGTRIIFTGSDISVSETFTRVGNTITTDTSGDQFTVPSTASVTSTTDITIPASTTVTAGVKSFTVVCESEAGFEGELFDGDCSDGGNHKPIGITLVPRTTQEINSSAYEWTVN